MSTVTAEGVPQPPRGHVRIVYLGPVAPHWDVQSDFGDRSLVEEFRQPIVDRALFSWLNKGGKLNLVKGMLDPASKEEVASRVLQRLVAVEQHRGKKHELRSIIQMQSRLAASALRGNADYRPFSFQW